MILTHFWTRAEAPSEPKSGVSGSLCLAVTDPEAELFPDLAVSVNCRLPIAWSLGVVNGALIIRVLQVSPRELGGGTEWL